MADFTSSFWNWYIIIPTLGGILGCFLLVRWLSRGSLKAGEKAESMGHVWDENLEELNNPLPSWWLKLFYITMVFGLIYLVLYPGLGSFPGLLGWSSADQYQREVDLADASYGPLFSKYSEMPIIAVAADPEAHKMGERLFVNYCSVCHGSDARGARGFPNLRDNDWLYGGSPDQIEQSILNGRNGVMPAWKDALGGDEGCCRYGAVCVESERSQCRPGGSGARQEKIPDVLRGVPRGRRQGKPDAGRTQPDRQHLAVRRLGKGRHRDHRQWT